MSLFKFPKYEQHPLAVELMPGGMDPEEFKAFSADIEQRGVIMPITLFEGKVLDGWHRYRAAEKLQCAFKSMEYEGKDPAGYIASVNVLRRRLSSLQRCLVAAKLHRQHNMAQRQVCEKLGVSNQTLSWVLKAMDSKNAKLIKRIETDGDFTRGMLREELEDSGALRAREEPEDTPRGPNSVFQAGMLSAAGAAMGLEGLGSDSDTDGIGAEDEEHDELPDTGKGLKASKAATKKAKDTAAQVLSEQFKALLLDEKVTFLRMIWPEAHPIAIETGLIKPTKNQKAEQDVVLDALLSGKPVGSATPEKKARKSKAVA